MTKMRGLFGISVLAAIAIAGCASPTPDPTPPTAEATLVGDEACASCHEELYTSFHQTGMGQSVSRFNPDTAPEIFDNQAAVYDRNSDYYYQSFVRGDTLFQLEYRLDSAGNVIHEREHPAEWVIGSGNATRSYLMNVNGHITQMPLTWYVRKAQWDLSPGYDQKNQRFSRPVSLECMGCHNGTAEYSPFTQAHYTDVGLGITCERCHGPGSEHVDLRLAGLGPDAGELDETIVNPAHLDRPLQLSICQQCHSTGTAVFRAAEDITTFEPGTPLGDNRTVFATQEEVEDPNRFGIASHAVRLASSACFQESEMTCVTCHDPHQSVTTLGPDHFNNTCSTCHAGSAPESEGVCSRPGPHAVDEAMTGNCIGCHMQKGGTHDVPHVTFTDHWIRRIIPENLEENNNELDFIRSTPFTLVRVEAGERSMSEEQLEEAIAYFRYYERQHRLPAYLPQVTAKAREALGAGAELAEGRLALGRALIEMDSLGKAESVLAEAVGAFPDDARLQYWHGEAQLANQDPQGAALAFQQAINIAPSFTEAKLKYAESLSALNRLDEAESALLRLIDDDPTHHPEAWNNLGFIYLQTNRLDEALPRFLEATRLDPDMATAWTNAGTVELLNEQYEAAAAYLERALNADAAFIPALGNLAMVYYQLGRAADAISALQRLLLLQPSDQRARALLAQIQSESSSR